MDNTRSLSSLVVSALAVLGLLVAFPVAPARAVEDVTPARVEGPNRVATAVALADQAFPDGTDTAVIATAVAPQDALTGTALAGSLDAALLLVYPDDLPQETADALDGLRVDDIVVVGGTSSVSDEVANELAEGGRNVTRLFGESQYDTAEVVSRAAIENGALPNVDGLATVLLANGEGFADALAGSPMAYAGPTPVLYTETDVLRNEAAAVIDDADVEQVVVLGGPAAISAAVVDAIEGRGVRVVRLGGDTRVETSGVVAAWTAEQLGFGMDDVMLARGDDFPDSITAAQLAGKGLRPLVISATPTVLSQEGNAFFTERCGTIEVIQAVGGEAAVSTAVLEEAEDAAESCEAGGQPGDGGDDALPTYAVDPLTLDTELSQLDTVEVTQLGGATALHVGLFACDSVEVDSDGAAVFTDADDDGAADGLGSSTTGEAIITGINFVDVDDSQLVRDAVPEDDRLGIQVSSGASDCSVVVAFDAGTDPLPIDDAGRPTVPYGTSVVRYGEQPTEPTEPTEPSDPSRPADTLVFRVDPDEPVTTTSAQPVTFTVDGRFDDTPIARDLNILLFPCGSNDVLGSGADTFEDADGDGGADGFGATDTGVLSITAVNGEPIDPTKAAGPVPVTDDILTFEVSAAEGTDCATVVVVAGNGNGKFDVDANGVPLEDYGVGQVRVS